MAAPFKASIITPEAIVLETTVTSAQVPAYDGLVGILSGRAPLLAKLGTGILTLDTVGAGGGGTKRYLVAGGYAQMKEDTLTILATEVIPSEQVTAQKVTDEQSKLSAIQGIDTASMQKRQVVQARVVAMKSLVS